MSKKSKNPRKGRREQAEKSVEVETPQPAAVPKQKQSKLKRYKDLVVAPSSEMYQAMEDGDNEKVEKMYQESRKQWKADYGDFEPAKINQQIRERFWPWNGNYEKEAYDVLLKTGEIHFNCWPNAGFMMTTDGSGGQFTVDDVAGYRLAINPPY